MSEGSLLYDSYRTSLRHDISHQWPWALWPASQGDTPPVGLWADIEAIFARLDPAAQKRLRKRLRPSGRTDTAEFIGAVAELCAFYWLSEWFPEAAIEYEPQSLPNPPDWVVTSALGRLACEVYAPTDPCGIPNHLAEKVRDRCMQEGVRKGLDISVRLPINARPHEILNRLPDEVRELAGALATSPKEEIVKSFGWPPVELRVARQSDPAAQTSVNWVGYRSAEPRQKHIIEKLRKKKQLRSAHTDPLLLFVLSTGFPGLESRDWEKAVSGALAQSQLSAVLTATWDHQDNQLPAAPIAFVTATAMNPLLERITSRVETHTIPHSESKR